MKNKIVKAIACTVFSSVLGVSCMIGGAGAQTKVKLSHGLSTEHPQHESMKKFVELAEKYTDGRVQIQIYPGATLGGDDKVLQSVQAGTVEIYYGGIEHMSGRIKEIQIFSFPFVFENMNQVDYVYYGPVGDKVFELMKPLNLVGIGWGEVGFRQLSNNKREVKVAEDMNGLKIRVVQNTFALEMWKALGTNPVPMSFSEVFTALETGALDGQENPLIHIYSNKTYEVQKYITISNHVYTPCAMIVSAKYWDTLKPEDQDGLRKAAREAMRFHREIMTQADKDAVVELQKHGVKIVTLPPEEVEKLRVKVKPVVEKFIPVVGEEFAKQFYAEVDKARAVTKK